MRPKADDVKRGLLCPEEANEQPGFPVLKEVRFDDHVVIDSPRPPAPDDIGEHEGPLRPGKPAGAGGLGGSSVVLMFCVGMSFPAIAGDRLVAHAGEVSSRITE